MERSVQGGGHTLSNAELERLRDLIHIRAGIALRDEKRQLVWSRLSRRLRALQLTSFDEYYQRVTAAGTSDELEHPSSRSRSK